MATINPYLTFNGNTEEIFNFYRSVFGGEFTDLTRFKEMYTEDDLSPGEGQKIMHVALPIGGDSILMGSDTLAMSGEATVGSNFSIAISPASVEEATRLFNGLAAGGEVTMPLDHAPWGAFFGMLTDQYGIAWMVNYENRQQ